MLPKLNFLSCLAAFGIFFMPWLNFQCSSSGGLSGVAATQNGVQMIYGGYTTAKLVDDLEKFRQNRVQQSAAAGQPAANPVPPLQGERAGVSLFAGLALILVMGAMTSAFLAFRYGSQTAFSGALCSVALILLAVQKSQGFPAEKKLLENQSPADAGNPLSSLRINTPLNPQITAALAWGWYAELIALGIPTAILGNQLLDRMKKTTGRAAPATPDGPNLHL